VIASVQFMACCCHATNDKTVRTYEGPGFEAPRILELDTRIETEDSAKVVP
jgi:hypothetical protein